MRLVAGAERRLRWRAVIVGLAGGICIAALAPAAASGVRIGSDLKGSPSPSSGYSCGIMLSSCAVQQLKLPGNQRTKAPFDGVIRRWRFRTVADPEEGGWALRLRVVRRTGPGQYRFVGKSKAGVVDKPGRHRFKTNLRIRKGDFIALQLPSTETPSGIQGFYVPSPTARAAAWFPAPANGEGGPPDGDADENEYLYNATIRHRR